MAQPLTPADLTFYGATAGVGATVMVASVLLRLTPAGQAMRSPEANTRAVRVYMYVLSMAVNLGSAVVIWASIETLSGAASVSRRAVDRVAVNTVAFFTLGLAITYTAEMFQTRRERVVLTGIFTAAASALLLILGIND